MAWVGPKNPAHAFLRKKYMPMPEQMGAMAPQEDSMASEPTETHDESDRPKIFASKDALPPGFKPTKGASLRAEIEDLDPETGEAQLCLYEMDDKQDSSGGYAEAFDKAMPPEQG